MEHYFIKVPVPGNKEPKLVEVDPERLDVSILKRIFKKNQDRGGVTYNEVFGAEAGVKASLDISQLLSTLHELIEETKTQLTSGYGETGQFIADICLEEFELSTLLSSLAASNLTATEEQLRQFMYGFMANLCRIAGMLEESAKKIATLEEHYHHADAVVEHSYVSDEVKDKLYRDWSEAILELHNVVEKLDGIENECRAFLDDIRNKGEEFNELLSISNPEIKEAVSFLDNEFWIDAASYMRDQSVVTDIETKAEKAKASIKSLRGNQVAAQQLWQELVEQIQKRHEPLRLAVQKHCHGLRLSTERVNNLNQIFGPGTLRPYQIKDATVTAEQFEQAMQLLSNSHWAPFTTEQRMEGLINSAFRALPTKPSLSKEVGLILEQNETYLQQIGDLQQELAKSKAAKTRAKSATEKLVVEVPVLEYKEGLDFTNR